MNVVVWLQVTCLLLLMCVTLFAASLLSLVVPGETELASCLGDGEGRGGVGSVVGNGIFRSGVPCTHTQSKVPADENT